METMIAVITGLIVILIPTLFDSVTYDPFDLIKNVAFRILVGIMFVVVALWLLVSKTRRVRFHPALYALILFLGVAACATIMSVEPWVSVWGKYRRYEGLVAFTAYALFLFLMIQNFSNRLSIEWVARVALWTGGVVSIYGIAQYLGYDFFAWSALPFEQRRSFASLGNPALLAGYLVTVLPLGLSMTIFSRKAYEIALNVMSTILIFVCLITTFNRTSWLAAGLTLCVLAGAVIYFWRRGAVKHEAVQNLVIVVGALFIFFVAVAITSVVTKSTLTVTERIKEISVLSGSFQHRLEIWGAGFRMIAERPLLGMGPDTFRSTSRMYQGPKYGHIAPDIVADNAHNYEIQIASGTGMLGFLFFATLVIYIFFEGWRLVFSRSFDENGRAHLESTSRYAGIGVNLGLFTSFIAYLFQLLTSVSIIGSTVMWWFVFGLILAQSPSLREIEARKKATTVGVGRVVFALIAVIVFVFACYSGYRLFAADNMYFMGKGMTENPAFLSQGEVFLRRAIELNPWQWEYAADLARGYYRKFNQTGNPDDLERAIMYAEYTHRVESHEADIRALLVQLYLAKSDFDSTYLDRAFAVATRMVQDMPYHYVSRLSLGIVALRRGDLELARRELGKAVELNPTSAIAFAYLGETVQLLGDHALAQIYYKRAIDLDPSMAARFTTQPSGTTTQ
jgi:O-antigen ligase